MRSKFSRVVSAAAVAAAVVGFTAQAADEPKLFQTAAGPRLGTTTPAA